ncbi:MAG TPA: hypothetical protein VM694_27930 [Polyangium sp.]|nr:hypothetical protein [Polyangium sp.]
MPTARRRLESKDIPQADSLENVRRIIDAVADGSKTKADVSDRTGINPRHVLYGLHTARVLGFLAEEEGSGFGTTELGKALGNAAAGSAEEREAFRKSIHESDIIGAIAPGILSDKPPTQDAITKQIVKLSGLSDSTAGRRAQTLISWRTQILSQLGTGVVPSADDAADAADESDDEPVAQA